MSLLHFCSLTNSALQINFFICLCRDFEQGLKVLQLLGAVDQVCLRVMQQIKAAGCADISQLSLHKSTPVPKETDLRKALILVSSHQLLTSPPTHCNEHNAFGIKHINGSPMCSTIGLLSQDGNWIGGRALLVQLGDITDRCGWGRTHSRHTCEHKLLNWAFCGISKGRVVGPVDEGLSFVPL